MTVSTPPSKGASGNEKSGYVVCDLEEGELFLRGPAHKVYRLKWRKTDKDRRRVLPVGRYSVTGYRVVRRDKKGVPWFISTTSHGYRKLVVRSNREARVRVDPVVLVNVRAEMEAGTLHAQMTINGKRPGRLLRKHPIGLSIYRDGKRIPVGYRFLDRRGQVIARGTFKYG